MEPTSIQLSRYHLALAPVLVSNIFLPESFQNDSGHCKGDSRVYNSNKCRVYARYGGLLKWGTPKSSKLDHFTSIETMVLGISLKTHLYIYIQVLWIVNQTSTWLRLAPNTHQRVITHRDVVMMPVSITQTNYVNLSLTHLVSFASRLSQSLHPPSHTCNHRPPLGTFETLTAQQLSYPESPAKTR